MDFSADQIRVKTKRSGVRAAPAPAVEKGSLAGAHGGVLQPLTTSRGAEMVRLMRRRELKLVEVVEGVRQLPICHLYGGVCAGRGRGCKDLERGRGIVLRLFSLS